VNDHGFAPREAWTPRQVALVLECWRLLEVADKSTDADGKGDRVHVARYSESILRCLRAGAHPAQWRNSE